MQEEKWGVLERFRVRRNWKDRVEREYPGLFHDQMRRRASLLPQDVHVLGPFLLDPPESKDEAPYWTVLWQFPTKEMALQLMPILEDSAWTECVETELIQGPKFDPNDLLPGF